MEVSVSFTDGTETKDSQLYAEDRSECGRVYINRESVLVTGPVCVRYEKHPWIEQFELDGVKAAPAKRTGIGTKGAKGFVKSLNTIYAKAYDEYREYGGDESFDAERYFAHAAEHFLHIAQDENARKLYRMFTGFVENMWREGNEEMLHVAMDVMLPAIRQDANAWKLFEDNITEEFRDYITNEDLTKENGNG